MGCSIVRLFLFVFAVSVITPGFVEADNLADNPGFENGTTGWTKIGDCTLSTSPLSRSGDNSAFVSDRTDSWNGISQSMLNVMENTKTYKISGWVRLQNAVSDDIGITIMQEDSSGTEYLRIFWTTAHDDRWDLLSGAFTLNVVGELTTLYVYFEGPAPGVDFYVDDVAIEEVNWRTETNARIEQIRKRDVQISVFSSQGEPFSNIDMEIRQIKHRFGFGSTLDYNLLINTDYGDFFKNNFEWATLDSELKWYVNEPEQGRIDYTGANTMYDFCSENDITMRGHSIFWAGEAFVPAWLTGLSVPELQTAVENRLNSVVPEFKDKCVHWEINNEMLYGSFFKDNLVEVNDLPVRAWMFQQAHSLDPNCELFVNEYATIAFGVKMQECKDLIAELLEAGAPVHGLGLQCHVETHYNRGLFLTRFDNMAEPNLPIWISEFDVDQPDEVYRAKDIEDLYRIGFGHPAIEGIILFGFWEESHWRPNGHIVNADWTLNEAGHRYQALLDEWTTELNAVTDTNGSATFRGFHGTYEVTLYADDGQPITKTIEISPGDGVAEFTFQLEADDLPLSIQKSRPLSETFPKQADSVEDEPYGRIRGLKWEDLDGYGLYDPNYPVLSGVTIYLDLDENGQVDANEPSTVTDENGEYIFQDLAPGTYKVAEIVPAGWQQSFPVHEGKLLLVETVKDGQGQVNGLDSACSITISPDGNNVYAAGTYDDALTVFSRDASTGRLTFVEVIEDDCRDVDGLNGISSVATSPDGNNVYAAGAYDDALVVFSRNQATGELTFVEVLIDDHNQVDGLDFVRSLTVGPDGNYVYATGAYEDKLAVFSRDQSTGRLTFIQVLQDGQNGVEGLHGICSVAVSTDSNHVYTVGTYDNALTLFDCNDITGQLEFVEFWRDDHNGVDGLYGASCVAVSPDGDNVYVTSIYDNSVTSFSRDRTTGHLTFMQMLQDGENFIDGLAGAHFVKLSPDGDYLFVAGKYDDALAVFHRDRITGHLTFAEMVQDDQGGVDGLDGVTSVAVSQDSNYVYATGAYDDALTVLRSSQGLHYVKVDPGQTVEDIQFGNYKQRREFSGMTWEDLDIDGMWDASEPVLAGVVIYLDLNENNQLDSGEPSTMTDDQGEYTFSDLEVRTYKVAQVDPAGQYTWRQSFPPAQQDELDFIEIFKDGQDNIDGLCGAYSVILSPDDSYVYAIGTCDSSLTVFSRDEGSGQLTFVQMFTDGVDLVDGLDGAHSVTVSPGGKHVYVAGTYDDAIAVFQYNQTTKHLVFTEQVVDGQNGVDGLQGVFSVTVSPDGNNVYAAGTLESTVSVFARDRITGQLTFVEMLEDDENGVEGLAFVRSVEVSPDGNNLYAAGTFDNAISVFSRDKEDGRLTFVEVLRDDVNGVDGLGAVVSLRVSPNGEHLYAAGANDDAVAVFVRDPNSGQLTFVEALKDDENEVDGLDGASSVVLSRDGGYVYVAGTYDNAVAVFARDKNTGRLTFLNVFTDPQTGGDNRLAAISSVAVSSSGGHLYAAASSYNAIAVLKQGSHFVDIVQGSTIRGINFGSYEQRREIHGAVWEDIDADGFWDNGEPLLIGATVYLDLNENGWLDINEPSTLTDEEGEFLFRKLDPNMYSVAMVAPYGSPAWIQSLPPKNGELAFVEMLSNGQGVVEGLDGAYSLTVSPDGKNAYVISNVNDSLVTFDRDQVSGQLSFVEALYNDHNGVEGLSGVHSVTVSPDGKHLYTAGSDDDALGVFDRSQTTGLPVFVEVLRNGADGVDGLYGVRSVVVSPDGNNVYAAGTFDDALVVFGRDTITGRLTFIESLKDGQGDIEGLVGVRSLVVSPEGNHVYVASVYSDAVAVFGRDGNTGRLVFLQVLEDNNNGVTGLDGVGSIVITDDGRHIYTVSRIDDALTVFYRDQTTGQLTFVEVLWNNRNGITGLDGAGSIAVSPNGDHICVAGSANNAITVFSRDHSTGLLTLTGTWQDDQDNVDGLNAVGFVTISPDAQHVYTASASEDAIAVFRRGAYRLNVAVGQVLDHVNFGYYEPAEIRGSTWDDIDADGSWDSGEPCLPDVNIYLDENKNSQLDAWEASTTTDESGEYVLGGLKPGTQTLVGIPPDGWGQSFPPNASDLAFAEAIQDGQGPVDGLHGAFSVAISPDSSNVYVAGTYDDAIAVFTRDRATGHLDFIQTIENGADDVTGLDGVHSVTLSPDGKFVYAAGTYEDALVAFSRDSDTGHLTFIQTLNNSDDGIDGLSGVFSTAISPDGDHLYAAGTYGDTLSVFGRNPDTGHLVFIDVLTDDENGVDGLDSVRSVTVSPDGKHVYASGTYDNAIAIFSRNTSTGRLTFVDAIIDDQNGVDGLAATTSVTLSPDGRYVYAAGSQDNSVAVFSRNAMTGHLTFLETIKNGQGEANGLTGACAVTVSPDGRGVYVTGWADDALVKLDRDTTTGRLTFDEVLIGGQLNLDSLDGVVSVSVSPNGKYLYTAASLDNAVTVFKVEGPQHVDVALGEQVQGVNFGMHKFLRSDLDSDCRVNFKDFTIFASKWGQTGCQSTLWCDGTDIDRKGSVNIADMAVIATEWLQCRDLNDSTCQ